MGSTIGGTISFDNEHSALGTNVDLITNGMIFANTLITYPLMCPGMPHSAKTVGIGLVVVDGTIVAFLKHNDPSDKQSEDLGKVVTSVAAIKGVKSDLGSFGVMR